MKGNGEKGKRKKRGVMGDRCSIDCIPERYNGGGFLFSSLSSSRDKLVTFVVIQAEDTLIAKQD